MGASFCVYVIQSWIFLILFEVKKLLFFKFQLQFPIFANRGKMPQTGKEIISVLTNKTKDGRNKIGFF